MALFKPEIGLIFWMLVIFLIVLGILAKFAWPAIIRSIEKRADFIDSGVKYTENAIQQLDEAKHNARLLVDEAHKKQLDIMRETEQMKKELVNEAHRAAEVEAKKMIEEANRSIERAKLEAEHQFRQQVKEFSLEIAEKLLRKELDNKENQEKLIDRMLDEISKN